MRLICFWCFLVGVVKAQNEYYTPQTFRQQLDGYRQELFSPAGRDVTAQSSAQGWTPSAREVWGGPSQTSPPVFPKQDAWRLPISASKEQKATILHHKQALSSEGSFRFEYASDNGLAAGEQIEPDGSRVGGYQYKDPSGQLVKLKYRAGKDGFQILEGSHLPKSPEPVAPPNQENHYQQAYAQQKQQYDLQQQYNQQPRQEGQQRWTQAQGAEGTAAGQKGAGGQYFNQWRQQGGQVAGSEDDGQYRENDVRENGPHNFGGGYAFSFQG